MELLLEIEEDGHGNDDESEGEIEDARLPGHHDPSVAAESVPSTQLLPFAFGPGAWGPSHCYSPICSSTSQLI